MSVVSYDSEVFYRYNVFPNNYLYTFTQELNSPEIYTKKKDMRDLIQID